DHEWSGEERHCPPVRRERRRRHDSPDTRCRSGTEEVVVAFICQGERVVNRVHQGRLLLALAGGLLLLAVVSYLISESENDQQRRASAIRAADALRIQADRAMQDRKIYNAELDRTRKDRARYDSQQDAIIKSLERIEAALE